MRQEYLIDGQWVSIDEIPGIYPAMAEVLQQRDEHGALTSYALLASIELSRLLAVAPFRIVIVVSQDEAIAWNLNANPDLD